MFGAAVGPFQLKGGGGQARLLAKGDGAGEAGIGGGLGAGIGGGEFDPNPPALNDEAPF